MAEGEGDRFQIVERKKTLAGIGAGYPGGLLLHALAYALSPVLPAMAREDRFFMAVELTSFPALLVLAMFISCGRAPDTEGAINPLLGQESQRWKINQRVLTNTIEQTAIFVPLFLTLSLRIDAAHAKVIPIQAALWVAARIVFWIGYRRSPALRAPGMAATSATNIATMVWLVRSFAAT